MASAEGNQSQARLGICRLVEETSGHETIKFLGTGCLSHFESVSFLESVGTPNSQKFLVASNQVLTKGYLRAIEKQKSKKAKSCVTIFAEFPGTKDGSLLERKPLSDFYNSLERDVFEVNDIIYICVTKKLQGGVFNKKSLLDRSLHASSFKEETLSSAFAFDQLQCLVYCGETTPAKTTSPATTFSIRTYDLLQFDSFLAADDARPKYFLRSEEKERFVKEDEFDESEKPLGAVIVNKDYNLAGFLNFHNKIPTLVLVGIDSAKLDAANIQHSKIIKESPVGASGGIYPPLEQGAKSEVGVDTQAKTTPGKSGQLTETAVAPVEAVVAQCNNTELNETAPGYGMFAVGGDEEDVLQDEGDQSTDSILESNGGPAPTENSYRSMQRPASTGEKLIVNFSPVDVKEEPKIKVLSSQQTVTDGNILGATLNNNVPPEKQRVEFPEGFDNERRRHSFPIDLPVAKQEEHTKKKLCTSESLPILREEKRQIYLGDPLAKTILDCLDLLEGLGRLLDKEYKYGTCKCWKHIAEYFGIEEDEYQNFKCSEIHSPTEVMFEYLQSSNPDITIGMVKDALHSIGRQDVIEVLVKYEQNTLVCSLFDSDPDVIGSMAFLLDRQKRGLHNWTHLAGKLGIPRSIFKSFETCNNNNPTEKLFEVLKVRFSTTTVEDLISHLEAIHRRDVITAIKKSAKVKNGSLIKDLMEDLLVMDRVCELLNQKARTNKVLGWRHLGACFEIAKDTLDDLLPPQEEFECPTEALIRHLGSRMPHLTIADFIWALHMNDRPDALTLLDVYLPDGCRQNLLRSCDSERCQMNGESNSQRR